MKLIKLNGVTYKLLPQKNKGSCEGCDFNPENLVLAHHCKVDLINAHQDHCCGQANVIYERISLKENLSKL